MGIYIDKHFYSELFLEKKVNHYDKVYKILFDTIWPNSKNFEMFLSSSDTSLKIQYAKRIYEDFTLINNTFLPPFTILKVLGDQYNNLKTESSGYIPQDHVIHSINLYVLGIYVFFNSHKISVKLLKEKRNTDNYTSIKDFILKWQIFSLYHDVGYFFESPEVPEKELTIYKDVYHHIIKHFLTKHISKGLALKGLIDNHQIYLDSNFLTRGLGSWYDPNGKKVSRSTINDLISTFEGAICIDNIASENELSQIISMIKNREYLVSVHNEYGICISLIIRKNFDNLKVFIKNPIILDEFMIDNMFNTSNEKYSFRYYFSDLQNEEFWLKIIDDPSVITDIFSQLPGRILADITMETGSIQKAFFSVNEWIISELSAHGSQEQELYQSHYSQCIKECFAEISVQTIETLLKTEELDNDNVSEYIGVFINYFRQNKKQVKQDIIKNASALYDEKYAVSHNFNEFFTEQLDVLSNDPFLLENETSLEFFNLDGNNLTVSPFVHDNKNEFQAELFNLLSQKAQNIGITIDLLKEYKSPYVRLDHGVISAALLFQIACFCYDVKNYCIKQSKLLLSWDLSYDNKNEFLEFSAECIFAVLLHNVYNKKSAPQYGLNYTHNIDKDSFSYFCAFCDTIQKWGRPKQLDLSKTSLPANNFLEDEFDIEMSSDTICIRCTKNNMLQAQRLIDTSESFLLGISKLVTVKEFNDKAME